MRARRATKIIGAGAALLTLTSACAGGDGSADRASTTTSPPTSTRSTGVYSKTYADPSNWYCHPDLEPDPCKGKGLDSTAVRRDLVTESEPFAPAADPPADCFYVHPTVDWSDAPSNLPSDSGAAVPVVLAEAARFSSVCRVFAPRYPAASFGGTRDPAAYKAAYTAVSEAFGHWLDQESGDRPFVIIGHGQGADLLTRLVRERVDPDPALRERLLSAMLIGGRSISLPAGQVSGGTFAHLALCTDFDQTGCVIAYNSYEAGTAPARDNELFRDIPEGMTAPCTNPAGLDGSKGQLRGATFPVAAEGGPTIGGLPQVPTPYVTLVEYFVAECVDAGNGVRYLQVERPIDRDEKRTTGPLTTPTLGDRNLGTQNLDVVVALGDLRFLIERELDHRG